MDIYGRSILSEVNNRKISEGDVLYLKRSEINRAIENANKALAEIKFFLPKFGYWTIDDWKKNKESIGTIKEVMQGWDVTDFGTDDFTNVGAVLFTIRNGNLYNSKIGVPYCEKVIVFDDKEKQVIPLHAHKMKTEDIINRGNGIMEIELFNSKADGSMDYDSPVHVFMDSIEYTLQPGEIVEVLPGNSITLTPGLFHRFGCKKGAGKLVVGEVSKINDDNDDNVFAEKQKRFSDIVEDEEAKYLLVNEYDRL